ncbi:hypothetical protein CYMTET_47779 [Cymbomonas tetramitiformis]|uniref:Uncharacterized protein n=1 Tax=Cymbomonas tetramitiformis TaxID=36881 RepID=A0AAE0EXG6_9CHLO|nr:hypothetical protein CYMTET_47779 [Cymbomonas tetramitiformis]
MEDVSRVYTEALSCAKMVILDHGMLQSSRGVAVSRFRAKELLARAGREAAEELVKRNGPTWAVHGLRKIMYYEKEFRLTFVAKVKRDSFTLYLQPSGKGCAETNASIVAALSTEQPTVACLYPITLREDFAEELVAFDRTKHLINVMRKVASPTLVRNRIKAWRKFNAITPTMEWNSRTTDRGAEWLRREVHTYEQVRAMIGIDGEYYLYGDGYGNFQDLWRWLFANDLARHTRWYYQKRTDDRTAPLVTNYGVPYSPSTAPINWESKRGHWISMHRRIIWITRVPTVASVRTARAVIKMYIKLFRIGVCMMLWRKRATERVYHPRNLLPLVSVMSQTRHGECESIFASP